MIPQGEIARILNEDYLLIHSSKNLKPSSELEVFRVLPTSELHSDLDIKEIHIPIGQLEVICRQSENVYLARRFRTTQIRTKKVRSPGLGTAALLARFQGETQEVEEEVPGPWSAELDPSASENVELDERITIGDIVGQI